MNIACELEGKVIGDVSVWYTGMKETVEIGFVFNPTYSGKGYASEAVKHIFDYIFSEHPIHRIQVVLDARNLGSINFVSERICDKTPTFFKIIGVNMSGWIVTFMAYWPLNMKLQSSKIDDIMGLTFKQTTRTQQFSCVLVVFYFSKILLSFECSEE